MRRLLSPFGLTAALGTAILVVVGLATASDAPVTAREGVALLPLEVWAMRGLLAAKLAFVAVLGAALVTLLAWLLRREQRIVFAVIATLVQVALLLPLCSGNNVLLERYRWLILPACLLLSACGFWLLPGLAARLARSARGWLAGGVLAALAASVAALAWLVHYRTYPALVLLLAVWSQGLATWAALLLASASVERVARGIGALGLAVALPGVAAGAGAFDGASTLKLRVEISRRHGGVDGLTRLDASATREAWKVSAKLLGRTRAARRTDPATAPADARPARPLHVVLLVVDSLRRDHVGTYNPAMQRVTPYLTAFAREMVVYEQAYSPGSQTGLSVPTMLTGLPPALLARLSRVPLTLPALLRHHGYGAATSTSASAAQLYMVPVLEGLSMEDLGVKTITPRGWKLWNDRLRSEWMLRRLVKARRPRFEYTHLYGVHGSDAPWLDAAAYRGRVAAADKILGGLIWTLKQRGLWDRSVVIITSDHGEGLGEHGMYAHGQALYEEQTAVPLLVHVPGLPPGRVKTPVTLSQVPALVMKALGARWPYPRPVADAPSGALALSEHLLGENVVWRSVRAGGWVYHRRFLGDTEELYDLRQDPKELTDLSGKAPARLQALRALAAQIEAWEARIAAAVNSGTLPK